jgi:hypothetical protein
MAAFVLGNGVSRRHIEVDTLLKLGTVYGCNALYRTHTPHVLVSTDRPISQQIQESGYSAKNKFYTRRPIAGLGAHRVPQQYFGFSSGPIATGIAAIDGYRKIYMLGFDMGPTSNGRFNNVYAGTEFYKDTDAHPTFSGNWVKQLTTVVKDFPNQFFIRVCGDTSAIIPELQNLTNMQSISIAEFMVLINTTKNFDL